MYGTKVQAIKEKIRKVNFLETQCFRVKDTITRAKRQPRVEKYIEEMKARRHQRSLQLNPQKYIQLNLKIGKALNKHCCKEETKMLVSTWKTLVTNH